MLIHSCLFSGVILLLQSVLCSVVEQDEKTSKEIQVEMEIYPFQPATTETVSRKDKSVDFSEQNPLPSTKTRSRGNQRKRTRVKVNTTSSSEIPVQVIYDSEITTFRSEPSLIEISPKLDRSTSSSQRRRQPSRTSKKIDIRQTTINTSEEKADTTERSEISANKEKSDTLPSTEFPKRSRSDYFKKRTGPTTPRVKILEEKNFVYSHNGNFHYSYLTGDGTKVSSQGHLKSYDNAQTGEAVSGSVFYTDDEGNDFNLSYTADENGYRPVGAHLPTPPPIPPAIARALKYIADMSSTTLSSITKNNE